MFQNHILQMLALVAMEAPVSFEADSIRDEKVKALRSIRMPETKNIDKNFVRGQYSNGKILRKSVCGYRQEPGVAPESITETYAAAKLNIDNWRWKDVPFYLRAGKRLKTKDTEIAIFFKNIPHSMFYKTGLENIPKNVLIMQIQPQESISLHFQAKNPGAKICMSTLKMDFDYNSIFHTEFKDAYQRLLLDAMLGDQTLFTRYDAVETSWKLINPVLEHWQKNPGTPEFYPAGSESFASADKLIERDGHKWRKIGEK
jgi:glucose-6-phosphate 1-dehydrogenase